MMLSEKYKNALNGFKTQGTAPNLFNGCEAETKHTYRIIMTEEVPVDQLDEVMLEKFIHKEIVGDASRLLNVDL